MKKAQSRNLLSTIMLALAAAIFAIGVHQTINSGFGQSYGFFMFSIVFLFASELANKENRRKSVLSNKKADLPKGKSAHNKPKK